MHTIQNFISSFVVCNSPIPQVSRVNKHR